MKQVTISQLKNRLSAYLDPVRGGETIIVLDRDQPIARLEPLPAGEFSDARLAALERAGVIKRPERRLSPDELRSLLFPGKPLQGVLEALLEERREGR